MPTQLVADLYELEMRSITGHRELEENTVMKKKDEVKMFRIGCCLDY